MWMLLLITFLQSPDSLSVRQLANKTSNLIQQPALADSFWGVVVYAPMRDRVLFEHQSGKNFRPASNMKIFTTLLGFEYLGADYQYQTAIYHTGTLDEATGILKGDLIIEGRGDPSLTGNDTQLPFLTEHLLIAVIGELKALGLREVQGDIWGVTGYFDEVSIQNSWEWDDIGSYYGTPVTALSLNDSWVDVTLGADENGTPFAAIHPTASTLDVRFETSSAGAELDLEIQRIWGTNQVVVKGTLPPCTQTTRTFSAWNSSQYFLDLFSAWARQEGLLLRGQTRLSTHFPKASRQLLTTIDSPKFSTLAQRLMRESQNHYADCVLKTVARELTGEGSFEAGSRVAAEFLSSIYTHYNADKPTMLGITMRDGSGLSAQNYLKPQDLLHLLRYGLEQPYAEAWIATFPPLGTAGTLSRRGLENSPAIGRVWAKTGYIYRSRTLSGYALTLAGEPLIFSIMTNNYSAMTAEINQVQDHLCDLMVRLKPTRKVRSRLQSSPSILQTQLP